MTRHRIRVLLGAAALLALPIQPGARADAVVQPPTPKVTEEVDFTISCGPAVQKTFKHAVWTLHSFWYPVALKEFTAVTEAEPGCAMGYWGIAMSHWYPLWFPPSPASLKAGSAAVEKAMAAPTQTDRERAYIAAIAAFYRDSDKLDHQTRAVAYEKAMEQVYLRYPEDREAAVFYALALNATALPTDKTYANKRKAAQILNKIWAEEPNHPGVVHYLIHSDDSPQFAEAGLAAAICYSKIAPNVPHALHMPSHIFTRLGMWQQSINSNRAALAASGTDVHSMDYLEYAYLQTAQDHKAKEVLDELVSFRPSGEAEFAHGLRRRGDTGAVRARAPRLESRGRPVRAGDRFPARALPMGRGDDLVRARARRRAYRRRRRRTGGNHQIAIARGQAAGGKGHLLGQSGQGPAARRLWHP